MVANGNKENFRGEKSIFEWSNRTIWKELWETMDIKLVVKIYFPFLQFLYSQMISKAGDVLKQAGITPQLRVVTANEEWI